MATVVGRRAARAELDRLIGKWDLAGDQAEMILADAEANAGTPVMYSDHAVWAFRLSVLRTRGNADVWDINAGPLDASERAGGR